MRIKAVLFDADGVVINSENLSVKLAREHNIPYDEILPFFKGEFRDCILGKADLIETLKPWLLKWKWKGSADEFLQFWFKAEHKLDRRIINIVKELRKRGIYCYIATNQEKYRTEYMKENMGFGELFDKVFSSSEIGFKKPHIDFYKSLLKDIKKEHKISPNEVLFFDDSNENVNEAKKLGIEAHFYRDFEEFKLILEHSLDDQNFQSQ